MVGSMAIETGGFRARPREARTAAPVVRTSRFADQAVALGKLYDDVLPAIYAFVAPRVPDRWAAEDVTTRIFERAAAKTVDVEGTNGLAGFLHRVAASAVLDHVRRGRGPLPRDARASDFDTPGDRAAIAVLVDANAARAFAAAIDRIALRRAAARLADDRLHVLLLRYLDGFATTELAAALACSEADAQLQLDEALRALEAELERTREGPADRRLRAVGSSEAPSFRDPGGAVPLEAELQAAGAQARLALRGVTQPTRWFAQNLRARFVALVMEPAAS